MTSCSLYLSVFVTVPVVAGSQGSQWSLPIPPCGRFGPFDVQAVAVDGTANALGLVTSDAGTIVIGS